MSGNIGFFDETEKIKRRYADSKDVERLKNDLRGLHKEYGECYGAGDYLLNIGESYIDSGDNTAGFAFIEVVAECFARVNNITLLCMRMAEYCIENGETENGKEYLIKLCTKISNYEESIEFNCLTGVWKKYNFLVEGLIPPPVSIYGPSSDCVLRPLPEDCSVQIEDILALPDSDILDELSVHLNELSADGQYIKFLNKWEKTVFFVDELCIRINSGGFEEYLSYSGTHFEKAYQAFEVTKDDVMLSIMDSVRAKFPKNKIPKSLNSIQNAIEKNGIDFDDADSAFYSSGVNSLMSALTAFVKENKRNFR